MKKQIYFLALIIFSQTLFAQPWYVWTQKTAPPFGTDGRGTDCFAINGRVYLCMGTDSGAVNVYNDLWEYDPPTDTWAQKGNYPYQGSNGTSSFVINGEGYTFGGWHAQNHTIASHYKYNPVLGTFTSVSAFPDADRYTGSSFMLNGKGYYGTGYSPYANDLWEYNPAIDSWTQKASIPAVARQGTFGFSIGNYGYIGFGVTGSSTTYSDLWRYDPATDTWLQRASFPGSPRAYSRVLVLNNEAYIIGGLNFINTPYDQVFKYDPAANAWSFIGVFPGGPRHSIAAATANGKGYIGQGYFSNPALSESYTHNDWWQFEVVTGVGINEAAIEKNFSISPNPVSDYLNINALNNLTLNRIMIFDMQGKLFLNLENLDTNHPIDVRGLPAGNYFVEVLSEKKIVSQMFVKQ